MNTPPDGGPAFPCQWLDFQPTTGEQVVREQYQGMTLRDWFAGQALVGILSNHELLVRIDKGAPGIPTIEVAAKAAYGFADAMLKARAQ